MFPDLRVEVTAPLSADFERIQGRVKSRAAWIVRQLARFGAFHPLPVPRRYVGGETHRYLGRQYRLRIIRGAGERVRLAGGFLHITTRAPANPARVRGLLAAWFELRAMEVLTSRLIECHDRARTARLPLPSLTVRPMSRRWGTCTPRGRVVLNSELVKVPKACIDYVITHELCHLKAMNHGRDFVRLLTTLMPDWAERRERLDRQEI